MFSEMAFWDLYLGQAQRREEGGRPQLRLLGTSQLQTPVLVFQREYSEVESQYKKASLGPMMDCRPQAHSPPTPASWAPDTWPRERASPVPAQAPVQERSRPAGRGVIRGGAPGGRATGDGLRYGASVFTWPLVTAATHSRPVLFQEVPFGDAVQFLQCIIPYLKLDVLCSQKNKKSALTPCPVIQTSLEVEARALVLLFQRGKKAKCMTRSIISIKVPGHFGSSREHHIEDCKNGVFSQLWIWSIKIIECQKYKFTKMFLTNLAIYRMLTQKGKNK
ncbi:uncharacterized protein LOC144366464 [Ictidomys tridecemlineatus]